MDSILSGMMPTGSGIGYGQIFFFVGVLVQVAAAGLTHCVAMGDEQTEDDVLVDQMNKEKMRAYGGAQGLSTQDGAMDAEHGYNQAFSNQQASFPPAQQAGYAPAAGYGLAAGYAPAQSPQPLAPQPSYMSPQAVPGAPVMIAAPASHAGPAAW
eukprot:TRINITY_DN13797_c0_g1_i2.p1 TRINITY_DN13797_c0_g1~~TRINITY_DN13797_c0_g1_i2.p1  ORF type:complete len:154 (+),score=37.79 TRINITY_DN13797_c0_g1_i2:601-1062(+)